MDVTELPSGVWPWQTVFLGAPIFLFWCPYSFASLVQRKWHTIEINWTCQRWKGNDPTGKTFEFEQQKPTGDSKTQATQKGRQSPELAGLEQLGYPKALGGDKDG